MARAERRRVIRKRYTCVCERHRESERNQRKQRHTENGSPIFRLSRYAAIQRSGSAGLEGSAVSPIIIECFVVSPACRGTSKLLTQAIHGMPQTAFYRARDNATGINPRGSGSDGKDHQRIFLCQNIPGEMAAPAIAGYMHRSILWS